MYISISQAIDVYEDLLKAKNGNSSHRNVTEIYVYRLLPNNYGSDWANPKPSDLPRYIRMEMDALTSFLHIISEFLKHNEDCDIELEGCSLRDAEFNYRSGIWRFCHRVLVEVIHK